MRDGESPDISISASSSQPNNPPEDAFSSDSSTFWKPDDSDLSPALYPLVLSNLPVRLVRVSVSVLYVTSVVIQSGPVSKVSISFNIHFMNLLKCLFFWSKSHS